MKHRAALRLIERSFVDGVGHTTELRRHLDECDACREQFDLVAMVGPAARAVAHDEAEIASPMTRGRLERLAGELLDEPSPQQVSQRWFGAFAGAAVFAVIVAAVLLLPRQIVEPPVELSRGIPARDGREARVALRAFAITEDGTMRELRGDEPQKIQSDELLKIAYGNLNAEIASLQICAVDITGKSQWLFPASGEGQSIESGKPSKTIPGHVRVGDVFPPGPVRVFALFSIKPVNLERVRPLLQGLAQKSDPTAAARLPDLEEALQDGLLLEVVPPRREP